jgi:hypothetical protein
METTSVMAALNAMALTDPSNTLKRGNRSQSKVLSGDSTNGSYLS